MCIKDKCLMAGVALLVSLLAACHGGSTENSNATPRLSTTLRAKLIKNAENSVKVTQRSSFGHILTESELEAMIAQHNDKKLTTTQINELSRMKVKSPQLRAVQGGMVMDAPASFNGYLGDAVFIINNNPEHKVSAYSGGVSVQPYSILNPDSFITDTEQHSGGLSLKFDSSRSFESEMFGVDAGASLSGYGASVSSSVSYLSQNQDTSNTMNITAYATDYQTTSITPKDGEDEVHSNTSLLGTIANSSGLCSGNSDFMTLSNYADDNTTTYCNRKETSTRVDNTVLPYDVVRGIWDYTGNGYVNQVKEGLLFVTNISLKFANAQAKKDFSAKMDASYDGGAVSGNIWVNIKSAQEKSKTSMTMSVSTYQWGGMPLLSANAIRHVSSCDLQTDSGMDECKKIIDDINAYVSDKNSYGLAYQYDHRAEYPMYIFPSISTYATYGGLNMYGAWSRKNLITKKVLASYVFTGENMWKGLLMPKETSKLKLYDNESVASTSVFDVRDKIIKYIQAVQNTQFVLLAYQNNSDAQKNIWGSTTNYNNDATKINTFVDKYIAYQGAPGGGIYIPDGKGSSMVFSSGLYDALNYPSSYSQIETSDSYIQIIWLARLMMNEYSNHYSVDENIQKTISSYVYQLGNRDLDSVRHAPVYRLYPAEKFTNGTKVYHFVLASFPYYPIGSHDDSVVQADELGSSDVYLRPATVAGKSGIELFAQIGFNRDNSLTYRPYGEGLPTSTDGNTTWTSTICSGWSSNPIYILPGSRVKFSTQSTVSKGSKNENTSIPGAFYSSIGENMFPMCGGNIGSGDINCGNRAFFAFYSKKIHTYGSDACMRSLVKMQDLFRNLVKVDTGSL